MTILNTVLQNWSKYELYMEILLVVSIVVVSIVTIYILTKNRKIVLLCGLALLVAIISNILGILLINILFNIEISQIFRMIPVITLVLTLSNLGLLVGFYKSKKGSKGFKMQTIIREYFSDSIKQSAFLLLLGIATVLFVSVQTEAIVSISITSTLISIWFTYWISKYILK